MLSPGDIEPRLEVLRAIIALDREWHYWRAEARDAARRPTAHSTTPTGQNDLASNVSRDEVEKPRLSFLWAHEDPQTPQH